MNDQGFNWTNLLAAYMEQHLAILAAAEAMFIACDQQRVKGSGRGGAVLARRGLRRQDGTWLNREELEKLAVQNYESHARGGRARAAKATRTARGRFTTA